MAELDGVKEELVYLRLWLGIMVVAEIGLLGWLASAPETTTPRLFALGVGGMIVLGMGIYMLHRHIERRIREIRSLSTWILWSVSSSWP
jgi:hypothetical protein